MWSYPVDNHILSTQTSTQLGATVNVTFVWTKITLHTK